MLDQLNQEQRDVVMYDSFVPLLVLSAAGTGKTIALTLRIIDLVKRRDTSPSEILALTFTNKAAQNLSSRIVTIYDDPQITQKDFGYVGTFHSVCSKLLRQNASRLPFLGIQSDFVVMNHTQSIKLVTQICEEIGVHRFKPMHVFAKMNDWRNQGWNVEDVTERLMDRGVLVDHSLEECAARVYKRYEMECIDQNAVDFADLLVHVVTALKCDEDFRAKIQDRFKHVMVDEFQDTNPVQYQLIQLIWKHGQHSLVVVGDDFQAIYGWRGACVQNILDFETRFCPGVQANVILLQKNYRSVGTVLEGANSVIQHNVVKCAHPKKLVCTREVGSKIEVMKFGDERKQAMEVGKIIRKMMDEGEKSFAILYRTNMQSNLVEQALAHHKLPYVIVNSLSFFDRTEVKDGIAYLQLSYDTSRDADFDRIINLPIRGIGIKTLQKIHQFASTHACSNFDALCLMVDQKIIKGKKLVEGIQKFIALIRHMQTIPELHLRLRAFLDLTGYLSDPKDIDRHEHMSEMINSLQVFENDNRHLEGANLFASYMADMALGCCSGADEGRLNNKVSCMTLHASKGLEFDVVFMLGMNEELLPHFNAKDVAGIEDERRLCYVGMTRAKERLFLTYTMTRMVYGQFKRCLPSRFLTELWR